MIQFEDLGLAEPLLRAVADEGYTHPTPIQSQVIPALLNGRDVIGIAQTGTGKTASYVLPILNALSQDRSRPAARSCRALVVVPTRELAAQVADSVRACAHHMRASLAIVIGGVRPGPQVKALAAGVDIVIATPGRLLDHQGTGAVRLDQTTTVVLDEADQMLDLGFFPAIRRIMAALPRQRQTVLLSATMPKPIRALANDFLTDPAEIAVAPAARPIERIDQSVMHVPAAAKRAVLAGLLACPRVERAIVFTRTKRGADRVARHLEDVGLSAAAIHGNKSQSQRERTLAAFRGGSVTVLVATDIAARGIDIDDVSHVFNYELPNVPESYVHRIGRTARAGRDGVAVSLVDPEERGLLRDIEKLIGRTLEIRVATVNGEPVVLAPESSEKQAWSPVKSRTSSRSSSQGKADAPAKTRRPKHRTSQQKTSSQPQQTAHPKSQSKTQSQSKPQSPQSRPQSQARPQGKAKVATASHSVQDGDGVNRPPRRRVRPAGVKGGAKVGASAPRGRSSRQDGDREGLNRMLAGSGR